MCHVQITNVELENVSSAIGFATVLVLMASILQYLFDAFSSLRVLAWTLHIHQLILFFQFYRPTSSNSTSIPYQTTIVSKTVVSSEARRTRTASIAADARRSEGPTISSTAGPGGQASLDRIRLESRRGSRGRRGDRGDRLGMRTPEAVVIGAGSGSSGSAGGRVGLAKGTKVVLILALALVQVMMRGRGNMTGHGSCEARGVAESDPAVGGPARTGVTDRLPHAGADDGAVAAEFGHQIIDGDVVGKVLDEQLERGGTGASADGHAHLVPGRRNRGVR